MTTPHHEMKNQSNRERKRVRTGRQRKEKKMIEECTVVKTTSQ